MTCGNRRLVGVLGIGALAIVMVVAVAAAGQTAKANQQKWPPQFPREGATKLFENDQIIVWEQIGRPKTPFVHKHIRDILTFAVEPGKVDVLGPDLKPNSSDPNVTGGQSAGQVGGLSFYDAVVLAAKRAPTSNGGKATTNGEY